jgi:methionyl-tRNA formyltransferase
MRIVFIGTGAIGVPTLRMLQQSAEHELSGVVTQPDKPAGRDQRLRPPPIKAALTTTHVPILQPPRIKSADAISGIESLAPDLIVVMAYGQILPRAVLNLPRIACLNLHASLLPRWRGASPIQSAIAAGDRQTGITVMYMDEGLDTGDILLKREIEIGPADTGGSIHDRFAELAPAALTSALDLLASGKAPCERQDAALATFSNKLKRDDGYIDWTEPAEIIERKIRAFNPWPGAFTCVASGDRAPQQLKIFRAHLRPETGRPGSILHADGEIVISAGEAALAIDEVQLAGKRRMRASEFVRGYPPPLRVVE